MNPTIRPIDPAAEYFTEERCHIVELSNDPDDEDVSIARARVEPGVATRWHRLVDTVERYVIVSGEGLVEIDALAPRTLRAGDVAIIPAHCPQRITNTGDVDLVFLAICSPRFRASNYQDIEDEMRRHEGCP